MPDGKPCAGMLHTSPLRTECALLWGASTVYATAEQYQREPCAKKGTVTNKNEIRRTALKLTVIHMPGSQELLQPPRDDRPAVGLCSAHLPNLLARRYLGLWAALKRLHCTPWDGQMMIG